MARSNGLRNVDPKGLRKIRNRFWEMDWFCSRIRSWEILYGETSDRRHQKILYKWY